MMATTAAARATAAAAATATTAAAAEATRCKAQLQNLRPFAAVLDTLHIIATCGEWAVLITVGGGLNNLKSFVDSFGSRNKQKNE